MKLVNKIMAYNFFVRGFIPYVTTPAGIARYGVTTIQAAALNSFLTSWIVKFDLDSDPLTHTDLTARDIIDAYLIGFPLTQIIRLKIKGDKTIELSSLERSVLSIPKPSIKRSHVNVPAFGPSMAVISIATMRINFAALFPLNFFDRGKPDGGDVIGTELAITLAGAPAPVDADFKRVEDETSTVFEKVFNSKDIGKTGYLRGFYINARGEESVRGFMCIFTIA